MPILDISVPDECKCGGEGYPTCPPGSVYGSIIPKYMIDNAPAVLDAKTRRCLDAVLEVHKRMQPEEVIYEGMDPIYKATEKEWHDPSKRADLLKRMTISLLALKSYRPSHMDPVDFIRMWAVRLKGYLDIISRVSYYDVIPDDATERLDPFFTKF